MYKEVCSKLRVRDSQSFSVLLEMTGCFHFSPPSFTSFQQALTWLKDITQEKWLRKNDVERWHQVDSTFMMENRCELIDLLSHLGFIAEKKPSQQYYDYVLLLGALESDVVNRTNYMVKLWESGVRFNKIILLGSQRPLIKAEEPLIALLGEKATELDLMRSYCNIHRSSWPAGLQTVDIIPIDTPMQRSGEDKLRRPNIDDTINSLLQYGLKNRTFLAIANQPYIDYLHTVLCNQLPDDFMIDTVGPQAEVDVRITTALDSFARRIYADFDRLTVK